METNNTKINWKFKSISAAVNHVRAVLKQRNGVKFSVGTTPIDGMERMMQTPKTIFVRWTGGPSYDEIRGYLAVQKVTLHAGRGEVDYGFIRAAER